MTISEYPTPDIDNLCADPSTHLHQDWIELLRLRERQLLQANELLAQFKERFEEIEKLAAKAKYSK